VGGLVGLTGVVVGILALLEPFASLGPAATLVGMVGEYLLPLTTLVAAAMALVGILLFSVAQGLWRLERWALVFSLGLLFASEAAVFFYFVPFTYLFFGLLVVFVYLLAVRGHFT
jgi:hypothetical protein